jgi:hypothetical protein
MDDVVADPHVDESELLGVDRCLFDRIGGCDPSVLG